MEKFVDGLRRLPGAGRWSARITYIHPGSGKKKDTTALIEDAPTKAEALAKRAAIKAELEGGVIEWTLAEACDHYATTLSEVSRESRNAHIKAIREKFGALKMGALTSTAAQGWLNGLIGADSTVENYRWALVAIYREARAAGRCACSAPSTEKRHTKMSPEEILARNEAERRGENSRALVGDQIGWFFETLARVDADLYPLAFVQTLIGCRVCEAIPLTRSSVDWKTGVVTVAVGLSRKYVEGPTKNKGYRFGRLGPEGVDFLRAHLARMDELQWPGYETLLFPKPPHRGGNERITTNPMGHCYWNYNTVKRRMKDALASAGLDHIKSPTHMCRHTNVTLQHTADSSDRAERIAMEMVGHSSKKVHSLYVDVSAKRARAAEAAPTVEKALILRGGVKGGVGGVALFRRGLK